MKKLSIIMSLTILLVSCSGNSQNKLKRYNVESGIIEYKSTTSGKVMGSKISGSGTENIYFKDWGAIELNEEESTQTTVMKFFGKEKKETTVTHTMSKLDNGESYHVDFDRQQISLRRDMAMDLTSSYTDGDANKVGTEMLESMGGEKVGNETFMGYNCEVWTIMGGKQWMYKGAVLKLEMTTMGITTVKEAISAKFNVNVSDSNFELPDFPIQKEEGYMDNDEYEDEMEDMDAKMDMLSKMSFEEWKKMALADDDDNEMQQMSDEELRQTYEMMKKMIKMKQGN